MAKAKTRIYQVMVLLVLVTLAASPIEVGASSDPGTDALIGPEGARADGPLPEMVQLDAISTIVEVPPDGTRLLRVDQGSLTLVPVEWDDPMDALTSLHRQAVDRVEPWLKRDLAVQLNRMGGNGNRYAQLIVDVIEDDWVDEIAFSVAHTPPEVLNRVSNVNVLRDNVQQLYGQDADLQYADIVERTGEDGDFTTVSYLNYTGVRHEYPRDVYYWYIAHARVFWEDPARVSGKSFWRKAYYDEITYNTSGTLKSWLTGASNIIEAANASTVWMQMNMEFGYGTNPLQPVQVILERYGSCGQYSITTASSLKVAMIPARVAIYPASDHQWCEVYIDGHWMHVDASNDVAGRANVKEPELIRRTNSVNFNDAGVFERGWKPYMSAMSTFRSDDVVINSIDISAPDPSFSFRESGLVERNGAEPHIYTETSTVTILVLDSGNDPIEGAYVGIYRVGHDVYNPGTPDYPHFAYANYTNATGHAQFKLGEQGYCSRCDEDHYYAALVLSRHNDATNDFFAFYIPETGQEYSLTYNVAGNALPQEEPRFSPYWIEPPTGPSGWLNFEMEVWGRQRHVHGEWSQYETFGSRTSFDHLFPSDVDVAVLTSKELDRFDAGEVAKTFFHQRDVERLSANSTFVFTEESFLLLSNTDSHHTTKVVNITVNMTAMAMPRLEITGPDGGTDHSTADPLVVNGTLWDFVPIASLEYSWDQGETWTALDEGIDEARGTFRVELDASGLASGDHVALLRATDTMDIWRQDALTVYLDADDPVTRVITPHAGAVFSTGAEEIVVTVNASDNRELVRTQARIDNGPWHDLAEAVLEDANRVVVLPMGAAVGDVQVHIRCVDGVGRTTTVSLPLFLDAIYPILELRGPEHQDTLVVGPEEVVTVTGKAWDDHGVGELRYWIDLFEGGPEGTDVTYFVEPSGRFTFQFNVSDWFDGEHLVTLGLRDLSGREHLREFTVVRDATAPVLAVEELDPYYDDGDDVELSGQVTDEHGVAGIWVSFDGGDEVPLSPDIIGGFRTDLPSGGENVGSHEVMVRAEDVFGNEAALTMTYVVVDETDPTLTVETPVTGANIPRGTSIHVSGLAADNVGVAGLEMSIDSEDATSILEKMDPALGQWTVFVETKGRDLGQMNIVVVVEDAAGNIASQLLLVNIVDRTSPSIELERDPMVPLKAEKGQDLGVPTTFSDDVAVVKVEYRVDGWAWMPVLCQLPSEGAEVTVPTGDLSVGTHLLEVRVTDPAGNEAIVSTPFEVSKVPEGSSISTGVLVAVVVAVVSALVLVYFMVLRRAPGTGPSMEDVAPEGPAGESPEPEGEPAAEPEMEPEMEPEGEPEGEIEPSGEDEGRPD